jgi:4'-phosphopantetheinyl transferase
MTLTCTNDELDVWVIDLAQGDNVRDDLTAVLSEDERRRAERFVAERDRRRFVVSHGALRTILSMYTIVDTLAIAFNYGEFGKPSLADEIGGGIRFNLSHSGDIAMCAVTYGCEVGVDVEEIRDDVSFEPIATQFFSAKEQRLLANVGRAARAETFTRIWVQKEAYFKATGRGIGADASGFSVSLDGGEDSAVTMDDSGVQWAIRELSAPSGYRAAVATRIPLRLSVRKFAAPG